MVGGGIERVTLTLIDEFQKRGIECFLALRHAQGDFISEAQALTEVVELAGSGIHQFVPRLSRVIRRFEPTHIVTAMPDVTLLTLMARWRAASRAILVQGVHLTQARVAHAPGVRGWLRNKFERALGRIAYRFVHATIAVSEGIRQELIEEFGVSDDRAVLIYNPIVCDEHIGGRRARADQTLPETRLVAIGRLSRQKGFDVLIRALAKVPGKWRLDIYGGGAEHDALKALIESSGLESRVFLRGHTNDPYRVLDEADWLMMPSRFEGFGVVLVEALARGVPALASDCPHGPREILDNGRFGILVPPDRVDALAAAIRDVLGGRHEFDPNMLRARAKWFSISRSADKWTSVLASWNGVNKDYG
jgi:glycosyltransferase involved in cell wall biosynthesis